MIDININDLIGKPFKSGGRGPDFYDCWGAAMEIHRRLGIILPDFPISERACLDYHKEIYNTVEKERKSDRWEELEKPEAPCLILIKSHPYFLQHVGTYLGDDKFVHMARMIGIEIDRITNPSFKKKIRGYYRYVTS